MSHAVEYSIFVSAPQGDELLDNYGPSFLEQDVEDRRAALAKQYMFQCECAACRLDWPTLADLPPLPAPEPQPVPSAPHK